MYSMLRYWYRTYQLIESFKHDKHVQYLLIFSLFVDSHFEYVNYVMDEVRGLVY